MWLAVATYGLGAAGIAAKWILFNKGEKPFPKFARLLFVLGIILFSVSVLYFLGAQRIILHHLFAIGGIIYFYAVAVELRKGKDEKK